MKGRGTLIYICKEVCCYSASLVLQCYLQWLREAWEQLKEKQEDAGLADVEVHFEVQRPTHQLQEGGTCDRACTILLSPQEHLYAQ